MVSAIGSKMKGFYKGFKYISQMFAVKERELEIGYPTDVRHVAHMGFNGTSGTEPTWMREFDSSPDISGPSPRRFGERKQPNYYEDSSECHQATQLFKNSPSVTVADITKRNRRIKNKSSSSPKHFN